MSRSNPITWRNVAINNGASAAAFGNSAANFGRSAVQGLSIFSDQMQDRIDREDTLLTNEAIAQALSGGPTTSNNRRVDAEALQLAVERDRLGTRQQEAHKDDLLSAAVNRRLNSATAGIKEKDLETYDERFEFEKDQEASMARLRGAQADKAELEMEETRRLRAEAAADRKAFDAINAEIFGPERQQQAVTEFEQNWATNAPANATPEDKALARENWLADAQSEVFNNPRLIQELALKYGTTPLKVYEGTAIGQRALAAQKAADEVMATQAALRADQQKTVLGNAQKFGAGNTEYVRFDGNDYVFEKDTAATGATFDAAFKDAGVDAESDRAKAFKAKIQSRFKGSSVSEQLVKELVRDGEIPDNFSQLVDERATQLKQRAINAQNVTEYTGSGDRRVDLQNFYDSIASRVPQETSADEAATALETAPIVAASAIDQINTSPRSEAEVSEAKNALQLSVEGLLEVRDNIKLPDNPSNELLALYNRFRAQVKVADGGAFIPQEPGLPIGGFGGVERPIQPRFGDRKDHAVQAATTLQELQQAIARETEQAEADRLRRQLDQ